MNRFHHHLIAPAIVLVAIFLILPTPTNCQETGGTPDSDIKCSPCCQTPCDQKSPPPPSLPPPPPPPPKTPKNYCPPPPYSYVSPPYSYVPPPPGGLYPFDPYFSGANPNLVPVRLPVLVGLGLLGLVLVVWRF